MQLSVPVWISDKDSSDPYIFDSQAAELALVLPDASFDRILAALDKHNGGFDETLDYLLANPEEEVKPPTKTGSASSSTPNTATKPTSGVDWEMEKLKGMFDCVDEDLLIMAYKRAGGKVFDAVDIINSELRASQPTSSSAKTPSIASKSSIEHDSDDSDEFDDDEDEFVEVEDNAYQKYLAEVLPYASDEDKDEDSGSSRLAASLRDSGEVMEEVEGSDFEFYRQAQRQAQVAAALREQQLQEDAEYAYQLQMEMLRLQESGFDSIPDDFEVPAVHEDPNALVKVSNKKNRSGEEKFKYIPERISNSKALAVFHSTTAEINRERGVKSKLHSHSAKFETLFYDPESRAGRGDDAGHPQDDPLATASLPAPRALQIPLAWKGRAIPLFNPMVDFGENVIQRVQESFRRCNYRVTRVRSVINPVLQLNFSISWVTTPSAVPLLTYHGTRLSNHASIISKGLLVGGAGVRVAHGQAYGQGIYLGLEPGISIGYTSGGNALFVCAALTGHTFVVARNGSCIVIGRPEFVLPCFVVEYAPLDVERATPSTPLSAANLPAGASVMRVTKKDEQRRKKEERKKRAEKSIANRF